MRDCNDPLLKSWVEVPKGSDFPIQNLPFGIFRHGNRARVGVAIGEHVLDLEVLAQNGYLKTTDLPREMYSESTLNTLMATGRVGARRIRERVSQLLCASSDELRGNPDVVSRALFKQNDVHMCLPARIGDYVDFYSSEEHATNVGKMFRDEKNPLLPNWKHIPIGYHGRASSVVPSGHAIRRPAGQLKMEDPNPIFAPCKQLDFELEMGFFTCKENQLGERIAIDSAEDYIFGMVLVNDWSARDIQRWEYVPLGPFLAKSFATSISPWVVTLDALEPFRVAQREPDVEPLPYLVGQSNKTSYDIHLAVDLIPRGQREPLEICRTNFRAMYWSMVQQLTHAASNGTNIQVGDLYASGTISGTTPDSLGSMLELCWKGTRPFQLPTGETRTFIEDGDTVVMKGHCHKEGLARIGFGNVCGTVLAAKG